MFTDALKRPLPSQINADPKVDPEIEDNDPGLDEPVEPVELTPEEEKEADRCIDLAATPVMLKNVLGDEEVKEFVMTTDFDVACMEGFMTESFSNDVMKPSFFTEAKIYNKTKVQFDKKARFAQLFEISVLGCARAKNDPDYIRYQKVLAMRRKLRKRLRAKYKNPALKRAKFYLQRLRRSGSGVLSKVAKAITK